MKKPFKDDRDRSEFLYELSELLKNGYSLSEALKMIAAFSSPRKAKWIGELHQQLVAGQSWSLSFLEAEFSKDVVTYMTFFEKIGDVENGLLQSSKILEKKYELKMNIRKIIQYPFFLVIFAFILGIVLVEGILPEFVHFFEGMGTELPWSTRMLMWTVENLKYPFIIIIFLFFFIFIFHLRLKSPYNRILFFTTIPLLNNYYTPLLTYSFITQLYPLLKNGISMNEALEIIEKQSFIQFFQEEAAQIRAGLMNGDSLSEVISLRKHYTSQLTHVIRLAEAKGSLGEELNRFSAFLFRHLHESLIRMTKLAQPILLSSVGIVILFLFLSMMLPIFTMLEGW